VAPLLGHRRCHGNQFVPYYLGVVHMSAPTTKLTGPSSKELWCILAVYNMCPCDLDLRPIFTKIWSHDWDGMLNIPAYV